MPACDRHPRSLLTSSWHPAATRQTFSSSPARTRTRRQAMLLTKSPLPTWPPACFHARSKQDTARVQTSPHEDAQQHVSRLPCEVGPASPRAAKLVFDMPQLATNRTRGVQLAPA
ncbi:hypothetical protein M3J09_011027 [Ascochyta lentis]